MALVAQLDRASDYESEGQGFESLRAHHRKGKRTGKHAVIAQSVERILGKDKVTGSIPVNGSIRAEVAELADAHV